MAIRPANYPEWGSDNITESVEIDGLAVTFGSKLEPSAEWKTSGAKYNENTPRQYINWQFDTIKKWTAHFDERYTVGDVHLTISAEDATAISNRHSANTFVVGV